eukprot:753799-Hanusia_phi.AAC.3
MTRWWTRVTSLQIKAAGSAETESGTGYTSLLRSGVVMEERSVRPSLSAVHGQVPTELRLGNDRYASKVGRGRLRGSRLDRRSG